MIKLYLFDVEGTTTDIKFVHNVLFPYSVKCMKEYVTKHQSDAAVAAAIEQVKQTVLKEENKSIELDEVIATLLRWIQDDRKHPALKEIQGLIWDVGYSKNDFQGHVYSDVKPFFKAILDKGLQVGIYSSGSTHAQKLIFGYSCEGDLTPMISHYFDTGVGMKRETQSYGNIARKLNLDPSEIHFFSDIAEELVAASAAGFGVTQVLRPGTRPSEFDSVTEFGEFKI